MSMQEKHDILKVLSLYIFLCKFVYFLGFALLDVVTLVQKICPKVLKFLDMVCSGTIYKAIEIFVLFLFLLV